MHICRRWPASTLRSLAREHGGADSDLAFQLAVVAVLVFLVVRLQFSGSFRVLGYWLGDTLRAWATAAGSLVV